MRLILLSDNDYDYIQNALQRMEEVELTREFIRGPSITVRTIPLGSAWSVAMGIQVQHKQGCVEWRQIFESVEQVRRGIHDATRADRDHQLV